MELIHLPEDPLFCRVSLNKQDGKYQLEERFYDPYEKEGYKESWLVIAKGFESKESAENWLDNIRKEHDFKKQY